MFNLDSCPNTNYCDFESHNLCGYRIENSNHPEFMWLREQSGDDHASDHSIGNSLGHYMIATSTRPHVKGRKTRLLTNEYHETEICVRFWYKIVGDIHFNVRIFTLGDYQQRTYFSAYMQRGFEWALGQASISYLQPYKVK